MNHKLKIITSLFKKSRLLTLISVYAQILAFYLFLIKQKEAEENENQLCALGIEIN